MKYLCILFALCTHVTFAVNLGNEDSKYRQFKDGESKYLDEIGFDNPNESQTILSDYYYYYKSNTAKIGVLDSGFYFDHEEIKNTVNKGTSKKGSHGTFVASIISGEAGNGKWFRGIVDPKYTYGIYPLDKGSDIKIIEDFIISLCPAFDVFNLSFELSEKSYSRNPSNYDKDDHLEFMQKWRKIFNDPECKNTMFVLAGGNEQRDAIDSNGAIHYIKHKFDNNITYSRLNNVVVVGSYHNGIINNNYGESIDIYAPDNFYGPSNVVNGVSKYYTGPQSGSSISAPQVTATIGLILKQINNDPVKIKSYLLDKANVSTITSTDSFTRPKLNIYKIIEKLNQDMRQNIN